MVNVGLNGFGRIGKVLTRILLQDETFNLVAVNDPAEISIQAHLFKYDSIHGKFSGSVDFTDGELILNGKSIPYSRSVRPDEIDWRSKGAEIIVEASGKFTALEHASKHLEGGAGKVIISAPSPSDEVKTILIGINEHIVSDKDRILSNASCTTNSAGPLIKLIDELCGIESAYITTVHSYTGDQRLHDSPHNDLRRARAGALSIVPTTTGAAKAITKIFSHLEGRIGGCGIRVPVANGSLTDISFVVKSPKSIDEINELFRNHSENKLKSILEYTDEAIVSRDIIGNSHSCVFDSQLTSVMGNMVKVVGWYDNEVGYSHRLADLIRLIA